MKSKRRETNDNTQGSTKNRRDKFASNGGRVDDVGNRDENRELENIFSKNVNFNKFNAHNNNTAVDIDDGDDAGIDTIDDLDWNEFEILATFAVQTFVSENIGAAIKYSKENGKISITDAYIRSAKSMVKGMMESKKYYAEIFRQFRDYYTSHGQLLSSTAKVEELENIYVRFFVPESHFSNLSGDQKTSLMHDVMVTLFGEFCKFALRAENLKKVIDGRLKSLDASMFQDVAHRILCLHRKKSFDVFSRVIKYTTGENTPAAGGPERENDDRKIREKYKKLKTQMKSMKKQLGELESKLAERSRYEKINVDMTPPIIEDKYVTATIKTQHENMQKSRPLSENIFANSTALQKSQSKYSPKKEFIPMSTLPTTELLAATTDKPISNHFITSEDNNLSDSDSISYTAEMDE